MENPTISGIDDACVEVTVDSIYMLIVASCIAPMEWSVRVENERGISSVWHRFFDCTETAIQTANKAIDEEGVGAFVEIEGFEYLDY